MRLVGAQPHRLLSSGAARAFVGRLEQFGAEVESGGLQALGQHGAHAHAPELSQHVPFRPGSTRSEKLKTRN